MVDSEEVVDLAAAVLAVELEAEAVLEEEVDLGEDLEAVRIIKSFK